MTAQDSPNSFRQGLLLLAVSVALWVVLAGPAWASAGSHGLAGLTLAAGVCLVPGVIVLLVLGQLASTQPMALLAGSSVRIVFVFGSCLLVSEFAPSWGFKEFFLWLILYYFALLIVETVFMLQQLKVNSDRGVSEPAASA